MKTVYKYPFQVGQGTNLSLPKGAQILCVKTQREVPCLWALVDNHAENETREFIIAGTGLPIKISSMKRLVYIDTFLLQDGAFVFHVFEIINDK